MTERAAEGKEKTILVLDYDGTLHDSSYVYEPAFRRTMKEISARGWIPEAEYTSEEILFWVGFSSSEMWMRFHPELSQEQRAEAGALIGRYMLADVAAGRGRLYPGVPEALSGLSESYELIFFSNCRKPYMETHRRAFGLDRWIGSYYCVGEYGNLQKEEVFEQYIRQPGRHYIAVGDRIKDIRLAGKCGLPSIGCLYGFGTAEELSAADVLISDIRELKAAADSLNSFSGSSLL